MPEAAGIDSAFEAFRLGVFPNPLIYRGICIYTLWLDSMYGGMHELLYMYVIRAASSPAVRTGLDRLTAVRTGLDRLTAVQTDSPTTVSHSQG